MIPHHIVSKSIEMLFELETILEGHLGWIKEDQLRMFILYVKRRPNHLGQIRAGPKAYNLEKVEFAKILKLEINEQNSTQ